MTRRLVLIFLFAIVTFAWLTALLRIPFIFKINANDAYYTELPFVIWTAIDVNMGIVSVCLPAMAPLFRGWFPNIYSLGPKRFVRKNDDEARVYMGSKPARGNEIKVRANRVEGAKNKKLEEEDEVEQWPMSAIGVTKEVNVESDGSLSGKQRDMYDQV